MFLSFFFSFLFFGQIEMLEVNQDEKEEIEEEKEKEEEEVISSLNEHNFDLPLRRKACMSRSPSAVKAQQPVAGTERVLLLLLIEDGVDLKCKHPVLAQDSSRLAVGPFSVFR